MLTHAAQPTVVNQDLASSLDVCEVCDWIEKGLQIPAIVQGSEAVHGVLLTTGALHCITCLEGVNQSRNKLLLNNNRKLLPSPQQLRLSNFVTTLLLPNSIMYSELYNFKLSKSEILQNMWKDRS